jgi:DUF4097 and DUF4098 domain-containing protein YvlB
MAEHRFDTPHPVGLEIKVPIGDIAVETIDGEESFVVVEGTEKLVEQTTVELRGRTLVVELRSKKAFGITIAIGDFSFGNNGLKVRVRVPHGSDALVETASADMDLHGRLGEVVTRSASGDLTVDGDVERDVTVKTVSGDVRLGRVGRDLRLQSVSGDVRADSVGGSVEAKAVSGDVVVKSVREGRVNVTSVSGDVEIGVEPGTNLDVDAGSVSGSLSSEVPLGSEPGGTPDGPTLVVRGKTVSGDFRVFRAA